MILASLVFLASCAGLERPEMESSKIDVSFEFLGETGNPGIGPGQFLQPHGLAVTSDHPRRLLVADTGNQRIQVLSLDGDHLFQFGKFGTGEGQFNDPWAITVETNRIYVSDRGNHRIQVFDSQGNFIRQFGKAGREKGELFEPAGLALDTFGSLYVADSGNDRIQKFTRTGEVEQVYGSFGLGRGFLSKPMDVALSSRGNAVFTLESGNHRIQRFAFDAYYAETFSNTREPEGRLREAQALVTWKHLLLVADTGNDRIVILDATGKFIKAIAEPAMRRPAGIAITDDRLFVADTGHNRVLRYRIQVLD